MIPGYNHNIKYKEQIFHIQTEDSGTKNPHIITLLYAKGGHIIARRKTSYADIVNNENLTEVVRDLMQEQHKQMLRDLKAGMFDDRVPGAPGAPPPETPAAPPPAAASPAETPHPEPEAKTLDMDQDKPESPFGGDLISDRSLDEVILSYLADDTKK